MHAAFERLGVVSEGSWERHGDTYAEIYANHTRAALDPLGERAPYVFDDNALIDSVRAQIRTSLRHWRLFNAAPELVFLMRTLSGLYWILRNMQAEADIRGELEAIAAGEYGPHD